MYVPPINYNFICNLSFEFYLYNISIFEDFWLMYHCPIEGFSLMEFYDFNELFLEISLSLDFISLIFSKIFSVIGGL